MSTPALIADDQVAIVRLDAGAAESASIVSRTLLHTPGLRVTLFRFAAGQELSSHTNPRRALVQVIEGQCEIFHNDAWHRLEAGALLHLPPQHPHAVRAVEPFTMLLTLSNETGLSS